MCKSETYSLDDPRPGVSPTPLSENAAGKRPGRPGRKPGRRPGSKQRREPAQGLREPSERLKAHEEEKIVDGNVPEDETSDTESIDR